MSKNNSLHVIFEKAYNDFHSQFYRDRDPVRFAHLYPDRKDQEIVGIISALLAYGNVTCILQSAASALARLGEHPHAAILSGSFRGQFHGFVHRFTQGVDLEILCCWLQQALQEKGTLENYFSDAGGEGPMKNKLSRFVQKLTAEPLPTGLRKSLKARGRNLKYLVSDPQQGSACKRLNMFLRWMVRPADGIDLGIWKQIHPSELMLPVDTHILKMIKQFGWVTTEQATWKVVEQATDHLRKINPADPIRYDFSLCHLSMEGKNSLYAQMAR